MISCFPDPFPNEMLYSVFARYRDHVQYPSFKRIMQELLGNRKAYPTIGCDAKKFERNAEDVKSLFLVQLR
jgi:hypothetical protein